MYSSLQIRSLCWLDLVEMGARLDVEALVYDDILWWDNRPFVGNKHDQLNIFFTFAHFAALFRDHELLDAVIAQRTDLNARSYLFGSPLHIACDKDNWEMAEILLRNGAHADSVLFMRLAALLPLRLFVSV